MPEMSFTHALLLILFVAALGGFIARSLRAAPLIGYLIGGIFLRVLFPINYPTASLAEIGTVLLLFSVGLAFPLAKIIQIVKTIAWGAIGQIFLTTLIFVFIFLNYLKILPLPALVLAYGFALSSTSLVLKILSDRGEGETIYGQLMTGWLLVQDLAVIPAVILLPILASGGFFWSGPLIVGLVKAGVVILLVIFLGKRIIPFLIHKIALANSRELLVLFVVFLAVGTASLTSLFGVSAALGAFLAGVVISGSAETYAVFAEIRPLRDLFVAVFFVTLGLTIRPEIIFSHLALVFWLAWLTILVKALVNFSLVILLKYHGKAVVITSLGLSQVGEFAFVIFSQAGLLGLLSETSISIAVSAGLVSLIATPFLFKLTYPLWRFLKEKTQNFPNVGRFFRSTEKHPAKANQFTDHVIICGYGRVGSWVSRALASINFPFVIVDYNQNIIDSIKKEGFWGIFGDSGEPEVLQAAGISRAKAIVVAIPDRDSQENLISYVQTYYPAVRIISRVHLDADLKRLKALRVYRIVQPEFEAAISIIKTILVSLGMPKEEIEARVKKLRISHSLK